MSRVEFSAKTKREALRRSGGFCEAVGSWYGLPDGQRCNASFKIRGLAFDHVILEANSHDNSLENAKAVCLSCHRFKTTQRDIPLAAKTLRQQDKTVGLRRKSTFPGSRDSAWKKRLDGTVVRR